MKLSLLSSLCLVVILFSACTQKDKKDTDHETTANQEGTASEEPLAPDKPYPFGNGVITYRYSGDYSGKQVVYIKDFGKSFRIEEQYVNNAAPFKDTVNSLLISTGGTLYFINTNRQIGYKTTDISESGIAQGAYLSDFTTLGIDSAMRKNNFAKSGTEKVEGKECVVYASGDGSQFCFWRGINIKTQMSLGDQLGYTLEAVDIREKEKVSGDKFAIPSGIKFLDYDRYVEEVIKN